VGKRYRVSGLFILEVNAKDMRDAQETAKRILANRGIEGYVVEVEEVRKDKNLKERGMQCLN